MKFFLLTLIPLVAAASERAVGATVQTSSGPVNGHAAANATGVSEYLGIPYAKPPLGVLRFAPPVKYTGSESINGSSFGLSCPTTTALAAGGGQGGFNIAAANITAAGVQILLALSQYGERFSEDCLTLNVWVPSGGEKNKAVMLWIYGGGFNTGSTATSVYNGQYLADQEDVIVVSANYRLNIFGFPSDPSQTSRNPGLLDQRLALEWIRTNIHAFGGDPSRITMFGQSAGSASLDFYSYAYVSDPIVAGFIFESGTVGFGGSVPADNSATWFNVTAKLGCGDNSTSAGAVLACMKTKSTTAIQTAMAGLTFGPSVDNTTVFSNYADRALASAFIKAPLLIGSTDYEAGIFAAQQALSNITAPRSFWDAFNLNTFTCPSGARANISLAAGVPTWRYRWFGNFPNTKITTVPDSGAYHASELPVLFANYPSGPGIPGVTSTQEAIGRYIRGAWAAFAKNPSSGLRTYGGAGWPLYDPRKETLVRLAYDNQTGVNAIAPVVYDAMCAKTFVLNATVEGVYNSMGSSIVSSMAGPGTSMMKTTVGAATATSTSSSSTTARTTGVIPTVNSQGQTVWTTLYPMPTSSTTANSEATRADVGLTGAVLLAGLIHLLMR